MRQACGAATRGFGALAAVTAGAGGLGLRTVRGRGDAGDRTG